MANTKQEPSVYHRKVLIEKMYYIFVVQVFQNTQFLKIYATRTVCLLAADSQCSRRGSVAYSTVSLSYIYAQYIMFPLQSTHVLMYGSRKNVGAIRSSHVISNSHFHVCMRHSTKQNPHVGRVLVAKRCPRLRRFVVFNQFSFN